MLLACYCGPWGGYGWFWLRVYKCENDLSLKIQVVRSTHPRNSGTIVNNKFYYVISKILNLRLRLLFGASHRLVEE